MPSLHNLHFQFESVIEKTYPYSEAIDCCIFVRILIQYASSLNQHKRWRRTRWEFSIHSSAKYRIDINVVYISRLKREENSHAKRVRCDWSCRNFYYREWIWHRIKCPMKIGVFWIYLRKSFAQFSRAAEQQKYRKLKCVHRIYGRYVVASITVSDAAVILLIVFGRASGARCVYVF